MNGVAIGQHFSCQYMYIWLEIWSFIFMDPNIPYNILLQSMKLKIYVIIQKNE